MPKSFRGPRRAAEAIRGAGDVEVMEVDAASSLPEGEEGMLLLVPITKGSGVL